MRFFAQDFAEDIGNIDRSIKLLCWLITMPVRPEQGRNIIITKNNLQLLNCFEGSLRSALTPIKSIINIGHNRWSCLSLNTVVLVYG